MSKLKRIESVLLFLTLLFLPTQLGLHFWPQFSYIYSLKIDYLSPTLYFWDILTTGLLTVWILRKPKVNMLAANIFLFFMLAQALSLLGARNIGAGVVRLEQYGVAGLLGVFLASGDFKTLAGKLYLPLTLGILGESFLAILQFITGGTLGLWILGERTFTLSTPGIARFDFYGMAFLRSYATFPHPNVLAGYLLVGICIVCRLLRKTKMAGLIITIGSAVIFLTMSRTTLLAGVISLVISLRKKSIIFIIFIIVIIIILSPILFTRFSSILSFDNLTLLRREELAGSAWQMFLKNPAFGVGLNNFIPALANQLVAGPSRFLQPVHNIFLLALSETGLIGLAGLISLIGFPTLSSLRKQGSINKMTISWFIIIFLGMFDHYFLTLPQGYRLLFLVWGLSFSMLK